MFRLSSRNLLIIFALLYTIIGFLFYRFYTQLVIQEAEQQVTAILDSANALRTYVETVQKPVIYELKKEKRLDDKFFDPKILSGSYITRNVLKNYIKANNISYKFKFAATNPRNPENKADSFEAPILHKFRTGELNGYSTIIEEEHQKFFFRAIPIDRNKASCMRCHSTPERAPQELVKLYGSVAGFGEKIGDMRALISLKIPLNGIINAHMRDFYISMLMLFSLFAIFYLFVYIISQKDQKLRDEREERDRLLEEANAQLLLRVEQEIDQRLMQERTLNEKERLLTHQSKLAGMGEMIGNIAHQWRQPLTQLSTILISLDLRHEQGKLSPKMMKEKMGEANEQIQFMSNTIDDFRTFFSPDKEEETYHISVPIAHVQKLLGASLKNNAVELRLSIDDDFSLTGYPNEMAQALLNIVSNAKDILVERSVQEACIDVRAFEKDKNKIITIQDNAGGVNPKHIEKVFEPYFSTKHAASGTGVGLYMTKMIIEKHNRGTITVENVREGALFTIVFLEEAG
jgi:signal transduction histidine kinase